MWYKRCARHEHECLWCQNTIQEGSTYIHGDRPRQRVGEHERRSINFHIECFEKMKRKFSE